ncbi:aliphatic sulfonates ABC transporter ATP-binding protein [soil metagenome]
MQSNPVEQAKVRTVDAESVRSRHGSQQRGVRIDLRGVSKSYADRAVLDAIDLQIEAGEFIAIVGRSGCGKSTLLRLIADLERADQGSIAIGNADDGASKEVSAQASAHASAQSSVQASAQRQSMLPEIRVMFQDSRLLPWKRVLDNVALGLARGLGAAAAALRHVGLADRSAEWPAVLSGGQRQRVALARALVHEPQLLLLDEPLGALDALTRIEMQQLIESIWRESGFTAVLVTHDVQEAIALADRVLLIEDGRITLDQRIDLPRPRTHGNAQFAQLEEFVLSRVLKHPASQPDPVLGDISLHRSVSQVAWAI